MISHNKTHTTVTPLAPEALGKVRFESFWYDEAAVEGEGDLKDPVTLDVTITLPDGTTVAYVYLTDPEVVRGTTGSYHLEMILPASGEYAVVWTATGVSPNLAGTTFQADPLASSVGITVQTSGAVGVPRAKVRLRNMRTGAVLAAMFETDANGLARVRGVPPGDYAVTATRKGWSTLGGTVAVLDTNGTAQAWTFTGMDDLQIVPAGDPPRCRLVGVVKGAQPVTVIVEYVGVGWWTPFVQGDPAGGGLIQRGASLGRSTETVTVDPETGSFEVDLVQGARVTVRIPTLGYSKSFQVPAQAVLFLQDVRSLVGSGAEGLAGDTPTSNLGRGAVQ